MRVSGGIKTDVKNNSEMESLTNGIAMTVGGGDGAGDRAATTIQAVFRGYRVRRSLRKNVAAATTTATSTTEDSCSDDDDEQKSVVYAPLQRNDGERQTHGHQRIPPGGQEDAEQTSETGDDEVFADDNGQWVNKSLSDSEQKDSGSVDDGEPMTHKSPENPGEHQLAPGETATNESTELCEDNDGDAANGKAVLTSAHNNVTEMITSLTAEIKNGESIIVEAIADNMDELSKAAVKIQANIRGVVARKRLDQENNDKLDKQ